MSWWLSRSSKVMPDPETRSRTVCETRTVVGVGERGDSGTDIDGDASDFSIGDLAFACVDPGADRHVELAHFLDDRSGAADRAGWAVETGEEAISGGVDLPAAEASESGPDTAMVFGDELRPAAVADFGSAGG